MYDSIRDLLDALRATPETLKSLVDGINETQSRSAKGGDEGWSVIEVLCHLRDAEEISLQRMEAMRDQENPLIIGYDQGVLAHERNYHAADLRDALAVFISFRERRIAALSALTPKQWERTGQHNEIGQITILTQAIHNTCHDAIHCAQIARQLTLIKK